MRLPIYDRGGSGPPLVISHATGFCGRLYDPLAAALAHRFHVYAVDHRGHGQAGSPRDGDMSYDAMAVDLLEAIDALELETPSVFGHSMGATVALLAARRRPGVFAHAYLFEAAALPSDFRVNGAMSAMIEGVRHRVDRFPSKADALANFALKDPYRRFRADVLACFVQHGLVELPDGTAGLRCAPADEAECYARNMTPVSRFAGLSIDATLACGTTDDFGMGLVPPPLTAVLPEARVVVHEFVGHFGPLEVPERIAADVIDALDQPGAAHA
jgi:pimeloyl-ACP methyl ester carboxylesterase